MFRSSARPIVFTQYEHMRMAGCIAQHWGNADFCLPPLPADAFVAGVALHDFGYGLRDMLCIGEMDEHQQRLSSQQFIDCELPDKVAECVMKHHARRLLDYHDFDDLKTVCDLQIDTLIEQTGISRQRYEHADHITAFCDRLAFDFCFDRPQQAALHVPAGADDAHLSAVRYELEDTGVIRLDPWPLCVPTLSGYLIAFEADGYPDRLAPHLVRYRIETPAR